MAFLNMTQIGEYEGNPLSTSFYTTADRTFYLAWKKSVLAPGLGNISFTSHKNPWHPSSPISRHKVQNKALKSTKWRNHGKVFFSSSSWHGISLSSNVFPEREQRKTFTSCNISSIIMPSAWCIYLVLYTTMSTVMHGMAQMPLKSTDLFQH